MLVVAAWWLLTHRSLVQIAAALLAAVAMSLAACLLLQHPGELSSLM